jgi:hypothetical protein
VCIPEVAAVTVRSDTHARFVLASDGLWDVVGLEEVRCVGMSDKLRDPRALAQQLALTVGHLSLSPFPLSLLSLSPWPSNARAR